jgi:hypothetical protein
MIAFTSLSLKPNFSFHLTEHRFSLMKRTRWKQARNIFHELSKFSKYQRFFIFSLEQNYSLMQELELEELVLYLAALHVGKKNPISSHLAEGNVDKGRLSELSRFSC